MIANTASTAYPTKATNPNRELDPPSPSLRRDRLRIDPKLFGCREGGPSVLEAMGFDDMDLRRGFHVIETHRVRDENCVSFEASTFAFIRGWYFIPDQIALSEGSAFGPM
jgi:hypothetical protein